MLNSVYSKMEIGSVALVSYHNADRLNSDLADYNGVIEVLHMNTVFRPNMGVDTIHYIMIKRLK